MPLRFHFYIHIGHINEINTLIPTSYLKLVIGYLIKLKCCSTKRSFHGYLYYAVLLPDACFTVIFDGKYVLLFVVSDMFSLCHLNNILLCAREARSPAKPLSKGWTGPLCPLACKKVDCHLAREPPTC